MDYETADLRVREVDGVTVVRLRNESLIGTLELQNIQAEIDGLLNGGVTRMVLDFKHVVYAGSAALGMLIHVQRRIAAAGGRLVLSHSEQIGELLRVTRTARLFTLAPDPKAALEMF